MKFGCKLALAFLAASILSSCTDMGKGLHAGGEIVLFGEYTGERFGESLDFIGDVNGDGMPDVAVGAPYNSLSGSGAGMVYIFFGPFDPASVSRTPDMRISGGAGSYFGKSISGGFDLNGDSVSDFAVSSGKSIFGSANNGDIFIFYGNSTLFAPGTSVNYAVEEASMIISGADSPRPLLSSRGFGERIGNIGDFNRDGKQDLAVGAPESGYGTLSSAGALFIFLSGRSIVGDERRIDSSQADLVITGTESGALFGYSFDFALNLDGQGGGASSFEDDFVVGAPQALGGKGEAYVFLGPDSRFPAQMISADSADRKLSGKSTGTNFGFSVTHLKDIDGDGLDDLAVSGSSSDGERAYLFYGRFSEPPIADLSAQIFGSGISANGGSAITSFTAPSGGNLAMGATAGGGSGYEAGGVYLFTSDRLSLFPKYSELTINVLEAIKILSNPGGLSSYADFASIITGDGDINLDGYDDLLIGARLGSLNGTESGYAVLEF